MGSHAAARQLTFHPGTETDPKSSRDGKLVAFTGLYDSLGELYVVPIEGGEPRRLTYGERATAVDWTPDGRIAYRSHAGNWSWETERLWFIDPTGGLPTWTPIAEMAEASFLPDGHTIAYSRDVSTQWFSFQHYRTRN